MHLFDFLKEVWRSRLLFAAVFIICVVLMNVHVLTVFLPELAIASDGGRQASQVVSAKGLASGSLAGVVLGFLAVNIQVARRRRASRH